MRHRLLYSILLALALGAFAVPAFANNDIVQFGSNIRIAPGTSVHDTVCFFCNVDAQGEVDGDIVVFFGNVHIAQKAHKDVVNFFGRITTEHDASIGKDMVSFFGSVHLNENVSVGKDLVAFFGGFEAAPTASVGGDRLVQPGWVFWGPLLVLFLVIFLVVREYRVHRQREYMGRYPFPPAR